MKKKRSTTRSPIYLFWLLLHAVEIEDSDLEKSARKRLLAHGISVEIRSCDVGQQKRATASAARQEG